MKRKTPTRLKRCPHCDKPLAEQNRSGLCSYHNRKRHVERKKKLKAAVINRLEND